MSFQRARTREQIRNRQKEILDACRVLFEDNDYDSITLKAISESTSICRSSMYSYYQSKEDLFLDLLKDDYLDWGKTLKKGFDRRPPMTREEFCRFLTDTLLEREEMSRLWSLHMTTLEKNCSLEKLTEFKKSIQPVMDTFDEGLKVIFPSSNEKSREEFQAHFFIFSFSLYPYCHCSDKQARAMENAGVCGMNRDIKDLCYSGVYLLTLNL